MSNAQDELYLVDGSGFIFRAYFAMAYSGRGDMTSPAGVPVSAVFGFTNMLLKLLKDYHAPYIAVVFDAARGNFRNAIYPAYKANRDATPEDLIPQFPLIRAATKAFDIPALEMEGYEADDLIATYTRLALAAGKKVVIVSSDKDLMQLVGDNVRMLDPLKNGFLGVAEVIEKFGVPPEKVVDVQALAGDASDNVPGIPGIGIKTAAALIQEYGSLENLLARAGEIKQPKRREALLEHAELARISRKLVQLNAHAPVPATLEDLKTHDPNKPALMDFLKEHGFHSIIKRVENGHQNSTQTSSRVIPAQAGIHETSPKIDPVFQRDDNEGHKNDHKISESTYTLINTEEALIGCIEAAYKNGVLCIDTETTSLTPAKAKLVGISLSCEIGRAAYIPLGHVQDQGHDLFSNAANTTPKEQTPQLPLPRVLELLKPVLEDQNILKIAHNMKYDWQMLAKHGVEMTPCDDTMLMSYVLDGSSHSHSMDALSKLYLGHEPITYESVTGKGKAQISFDQVDIQTALNYAAEDADVTLRLYHILKPRLAREKMAGVYENIERPLIPIIARMELEGIKIDKAVLKAMSADFSQRIAALESEIQTLAGTAFNVASPKQIGEILFEKLGLAGGTKTKTGQWSTDSDALEELAAQGHVLPEKILEFRGLSKLKSTYTDALQEQINPATGRVHTSYHMSGTSTGRLASSDPNLQNIPIRSEDGRKIRQAFVAKDGHVLLSVDYSQVELRLTAEMAGVEALKQAFRAGEDIHALTAAQVFDLPLSEVSPDLRRQAKAVNFGIIYGISSWGLARQLGCPPPVAAEFMRKYMAKFPEIKIYMEEKKSEAHTHGFVKTLYGRKCFITHIHSKIPAQRGGAERAAMNAPLQGTAADIMKLAMGQMPRALTEAGLSAKMLLQVHDELIFEVPQDELEPTAALVKAVMERAPDVMGVHLSIPLRADTGSGHSWAEAH